MKPKNPCDNRTKFNTPSRAGAHSNRRLLLRLCPSLLICLAVAAANSTQAQTVDLSNNSDYSLHSITADFGGTALVGNFLSQPAGTGVFDPFLTVDDGGSGKKGPESGYNTDGHTALYLNEQRPEWNNYLRLGDLAAITIGGKQYYAFELDANEPGSTGKSLISLDNIRIYTSATDNTSLVQNDESNLDLLGTKRFALNDPLMSGSDYNTKNWIELDANQNQGNGGSGISDLIFYVPTTAFAGAKPTDFVWFYDLNGVNLAAQSGYEEWRAVLGPGAVPENGGTIFLVALGLIGLAAFRAKLAKS